MSLCCISIIPTSSVHTSHHSFILQPTVLLSFLIFNTGMWYFMAQLISQTTIRWSLHTHPYPNQSRFKDNSQGHYTTTSTLEIQHSQKPPPCPRHNPTCLHCVWCVSVFCLSNYDECVHEVENSWWCECHSVHQHACACVKGVLHANSRLDLKLQDWHELRNHERPRNNLSISVSSSPGVTPYQHPPQYSIFPPLFFL